MKDGAIHLIRHSLTTGNENRWIYGRTDLPLSENGLRLLEELTAQGIYPGAAGCDFVSSGMLRANQTLRVIYGDVPFAVEPGLREMDLGDYECRRHEELEGDPAYDAWLADTTGESPVPGGESVLAFSLRAERAFDALLLRAERDVIAVCHGGVISAILYRRGEGLPGNFYDWLPPPAHGFTLTIRGGKIAHAKPI